MLGDTPLAARLWHFGSEAISEAAGQLADNYAEGHTGNNALGAATKSFLTNFILNFDLDRLMGPFSKVTNNTLNPYLRRLYSIVGEVANEALQEPS